MDSDEVRVSEDLGESPLKKMKSLDMNGDDDTNIVNFDAVNTDDGDSCSVTYIVGDDLLRWFPMKLDFLKEKILIWVSHHRKR
jgi:hypothetical protein